MDSLVYLCGGINGLSDSDCVDWREFAKSNLTRETLDPMRRDYRGREMEPGIAREIVAGDIADIKECDFVLVWHPKPSSGTDMEMRFAFSEARKKVITVIPDGAPKIPWVVAHSTATFNTMAQAVEFINAQ